MRVREETAIGKGRGERERPHAMATSRLAAYTVCLAASSAIMRARDRDGETDTQRVGASQGART